MTGYLFNFSKKQNSTKQPALNTGDSFTMQLKEETSVLNPTLILNLKNSQGVLIQPTTYNYLYLPLFSRYYFIQDWVYINGAWECRCNVDVLASFKTAIGATSAYVLRSASMYDSNVMDGFYPMKAGASISVTDFGTIFNINTGCYVVGVLDCQNTQDRKGAVTYWAMTESELNNLLQTLYSGTIFQISGITSIEEGLWKSIMNPAQYIVSCMWIPVSRDTIASGTLANVTIGYWTLSSVSSKVMNALNITKENIIGFSNHPQISRGAYLNFAPFSRYTVYYPPFGAVPVDPIYRTQGSYLASHVTIDLVTGQGCLRLSVQNVNTSVPKASRKVFAERSALVGVPIQLSQVNTDMLSGVTGLLNSAVSALSGNYAGAGTGVINSLSTVAESRAYSTGYNGSFMETFDSTVLVSEFYTQVDNDNTDFGKPLMSTKTLNTLSGFIKCGDGHFNGTCYESERSMINNYLVDGFFYE